MSSVHFVYVVNRANAAADDGDRDMISEYWKLMKDASDLTATMKVAALRATFSANDTYYRVSLKCTLIKSLTAQAMLHWLQHDHHDSRRLAAESVCEIISITEMLTDDEYPLMDVVVSVCGSVHLDVTTLTSYFRPRSAGYTPQAYSSETTPRYTKNPPRRR